MMIRLKWCGEGAGCSRQAEESVGEGAVRGQGMEDGKIDCVCVGMKRVLKQMKACGCLVLRSDLRVAAVTAVGSLVRSLRLRG